MAAMEDRKRKKRLFQKSKDPASPTRMRTMEYDTVVRGRGTAVVRPDLIADHSCALPEHIASTDALCNAPSLVSTSTSQFLTPEEHVKETQNVLTVVQTYVNETRQEIDTLRDHVKATEQKHQSILMDLRAEIEQLKAEKNLLASEVESKAEETHCLRESWSAALGPISNMAVLLGPADTLQSDLDNAWERIQPALPLLLLSLGLRQSLFRTPPTMTASEIKGITIAFSTLWRPNSINAIKSKFTRIIGASRSENESVERWTTRTDFATCPYDSDRIRWYLLRLSILAQSDRSFRVSLPQQSMSLTPSVQLVARYPLEVEMVSDAVHVTGLEQWRENLAQQPLQIQPDTLLDATILGTIFFPVEGMWAVYVLHGKDKQARLGLLVNDAHDRIENRYNMVGIIADCDRPLN